MAQTHTVRQGEHISRIAGQYGFFDYHTIWDHPSNAEIKRRRQDPHVLFPGDVLHIPDKEPKTVSRPTGARHRFRVAVPMLKLRLAVRDLDNVPVANTSCELEVENVKYALTTNSAGLIEQDIPATAESGRLSVHALDLDIPIRIGHLDPLDQDAGWFARLVNLGYVDNAPASTDPRDLRSDIEEFQCDFGLKVTGELDAATKAKLKQIHGA
jgi:hypothetical protein